MFSYMSIQHSINIYLKVDKRNIKDAEIEKFH